jgi:hypothetical protein
MTRPPARGAIALQAYVRARQWSLHELARRQQEIDAAAALCAERVQALEQEAAREALRQQALLGGASFRAADLASRRAVQVALAAQARQGRGQQEALQAEADQLVQQMHEHRQERALLEHLLERRGRAQGELDAARQAREADALVAARSGRRAG